MASDFISVNPVSTTRSIGQPGNCHNRLGRNQYTDRPLPDDPQVVAALKAYHQKGINDSEEISKLLLEDHGVVLSASSVKRRRQKLGLLASRATTLQMAESDKRRLILEEMAKDPKGKCGAQVIKQRIFQENGVHLSRDYIREEMRKLDPESYAKRGPIHTKRKRIERLAREAQTAPIPSSSNRPLPETRTQKPSTTRFIVRVCGSGRAIPYQEPFENNDIESESENDYMGSETSNIPPTELLQVGSNTLSQPISPAARSDLMADASSLLENAIPTMSALTQLLNDADTSTLEFDQGTHDLFIRGIECAALVERQLSRFISNGRIAGRRG